MKKTLSNVAPEELLNTSKAYAQFKVTKYLDFTIVITNLKISYTFYHNFLYIVDTFIQEFPS